MNLKNKKVSIIGLGKSGYESALFLHKKGADVFVSECNSSQSYKKLEKELKLKGIEVELGQHSDERLLNSDFIIMSPGISPKSELFIKLKRAQLEIISEIELAFRFCKGEIIAITGTDGKTTVSTLTAKVLKNFGYDVILCGNIGNPFIAEVDRIGEKTKVVLEISSFQLYLIKNFRPKIAFFLNCAPDHLDWHYGFNDYLQSKLKIFQNQTSIDYSILNFKDVETSKYLCRIKSKKYFFNQFDSILDQNGDAVLQLSEIYKLDSKRVKELISNFRGLPHRLEIVASNDGICYINDSKATSVHALAWGLEKQLQKVVLICGGKNKGLDFKTIGSLVKEKVELAIMIGEAREDIFNAWSDILECKLADGIEDAIGLAKKFLNNQGIVLFSPGCASFDMFNNYIERGDYFKNIIGKSV